MPSGHLCCAVNTCSVVAHLAGEICEESTVCRNSMSSVVQEWSEKLAVVIRQAQQVMANSAMDRLAHRAHHIAMKGESFRAKTLLHTACHHTKYFITSRYTRICTTL